MKRLITAFVALVLCWNLAACTFVLQKDPAQDTQLPVTQEETQPATQPVTEPATEPVTEAPTQAPTEPDPTVPRNAVPYTTRLSAAYDIFSSPGYYYRYVQDVGLSGIYTVVAEEYDEYGNLWGKLKSGIGWVQLSGRLPESNFIRTCPDCGESEPDTCFDPEYESEYCDFCSFGKGNGGSVLFCWSCGADCTYRGVEEDGRCEDCYYDD